MISRERGCETRIVFLKRKFR